jgi:hypothetical protein
MISLSALRLQQFVHLFIAARAGSLFVRRCDTIYEHEWNGMHARELVELAAILASDGPTIIEHTPHLSGSGLEQYWSASRCRQDRWVRSLKSFSDRQQYLSPKNIAAQWKTIANVLDEVLTSEVLTRIWGAVCCSFERQRGLDEASPVVRNILAGHLEVRNRALNLMVYGHGLRVEEAVNLNRMRRRNERWNDMLLGYLPETDELNDFAFSPARVRQFSSDTRLSGHRETARTLLLASLRIAYQRHTCSPSPNEDLNREVASGILACLPGDLFESTGTIKSLWLLRMQHAASDTQGMIDELMALDDASTSDLDWNARVIETPRTRRTL